MTTKTSNGSGTGTFSSSLTCLTPNTAYYVRAYATNSAGTGYGNEITFTTTNSTIVTGIPCLGIPTVKDIDGNTYNTVQIGAQCWTKENLKVTKYRVGANISTGLDITFWDTTRNGAYAIYDNDNANEAIYGKLYNWNAVGSRGLCPTGWHVPTDLEWTTLTTYLGDDGLVRGKIKSVGTTYWYCPNGEATNESGFSALPGGYRSPSGSFTEIRESAHFWSATELGSGDAWFRDVDSRNGNLGISAGSKEYGFSVRCLRD